MLDDRDIDLMLEENIKTGKIVFPQDFPAMARDIVRKMLKTDPAQRLTLKEIIEHSWMK
jgi:serine/threonine protein kinase